MSECTQLHIPVVASPKLSLFCRRLQLPVESAAGDIEKVQRALARGLFVNAARLEGTAYDLKDISRMGTHSYALCRSGGGSGREHSPVPA